MDPNLYSNQGNLGGLCSQSHINCPSDVPSLLAVKRLGYPSLCWDHSFRVTTYNGKRLSVQQSENEIHVTKTRKHSIKNTETVGQRAHDNKLIGKSTAKKAERFQEQVNQNYVKEPTKQIRRGRVCISRMQRADAKVPVRRIQKLSDKITALQKLVSPYGKTDTASVLLEASISIKALQDQIQKLCNTVRSSENGSEYSNQVDLHGKGLCLVPVSWSQKLAEHDFFNQQLATLSLFTP